MKKIVLIALVVPALLLAAAWAAPWGAYYDGHGVGFYRWNQGGRVSVGRATLMMDVSAHFPNFGVTNFDAIKGVPEFGIPDRQPMTRYEAAPFFLYILK